ncbi:MAG: hypothetical protein KDB04_16710 [Acidimicrobiales bacterium]|nr:hypothetical protein [Acidimicrobiales bacterium]HRW36139.1 hypothetical protein [Aquihabitans sp.]
MDERGGRPIDDDALNEGFDHLVRLAGASAPPLGELQGRALAGRARRRRQQQRRAAVAGLAAVALLAGLVALVVAPSSERDGGVELASDPSATSMPTDPTAEPVFTIGRVPDRLAFRSCLALTGDGDAVGGAECTYEDPATGRADGLRVTRVIGGATPELGAAWDQGDAAAAAQASGGSDDPAAAQFRTLGDERVLDLLPDGAPSNEANAQLRVLVGADLVDLGAANLSVAELGEVVAGLSTAAPPIVVSEALAALPDGSAAVVQGPRPLWIQPDPLRPGGETPFGGATFGAEIAVPGSSTLLGVDVTTGIDVDALFRGLLADEGAAITETEVGGRRTLVLAPESMMPLTLPEPRPGPQVIVQLDGSSMVRVKDPDGSPAQLTAIAEALR